MGWDSALFSRSTLATLGSHQGLLSCTHQSQSNPKLVHPIGYKPIKCCLVLSVSGATPHLDHFFYSQGGRLACNVPRNGSSFLNFDASSMTPTRLSMFEEVLK